MRRPTAIVWSRQQRLGRAKEGTVVLPWGEPIVAVAAGERLGVAKRTLWNGMGFGQTWTKGESANLVEGLLGLGEWNAGY